MVQLAQGFMDLQTGSETNERSFHVPIPGCEIGPTAMPLKSQSSGMDDACWSGPRIGAGLGDPSIQMHNSRDSEIYVWRRRLLWVPIAHPCEPFVGVYISCSYKQL